MYTSPIGTALDPRTATREFHVLLERLRRLVPKKSGRAACPTCSGSRATTGNTVRKMSMKGVAKCYRVARSGFQIGFQRHAANGL